MDVHPDLAAVSWLLGRWTGEGEGWYPTVADFAYREEAVWEHAGKPVFVYASATRALDDGRPLHGERGYLRAAGGQLELVLAHSNGIVEVAIGPHAPALALSSTSIVGAPGAKAVTALDRRVWLEDGELRYELGMAAVGQARHPHLRASLRQT